MSRPCGLDPAVAGACRPPANGSRWRSAVRYAAANIIGYLHFFSPPLPLEPAFENIGPETPMRASLADPKGAGYRAFGSMPPQGAGRDAKHPCGLRKPDGPPLVELGKDHMSSLVSATSALHPRSPPSIIPGSSSCTAIWPSRTHAAFIRVSIIACISSWLRTVLRLGGRGTQPLLFQRMESPIELCMSSTLIASICLFLLLGRLGFYGLFYKAFKCVIYCSLVSRPDPLCADML